jgi:thioredoxin-like negative regulator of GroEL
MSAGFLKKLFGSQPPLEKLRIAVAQKNYAEAVHLAADLCAVGEPSAEALELKAAAGDGLAHLNLEEARRCAEAGSLTLALEHLQLARTQALSPDLVCEIDQLQQQLETPPSAPAAPASTVAATCSSCRPNLPHDTADFSSAPPGDERFALILAGYPPELARRYAESSPLFRQAFLLVHEGEDHQALALFKQIPVAEQDGLYWFELGSLQARQAGAAAGRPLLERALKLEPANPMIMEALFEVLLAQQDFSGAEKMLKQQQKAGADAAYCEARLALSFLSRGDRAAALGAARKALAAGFAEPEFLVMAAGLLEAAGETATAEGLLAALPSAGCGGGINPHLAEFWLRQRRELGKVLDSFNDACRKEPDNPRWQLRVAQTYLARNWRKQGLDILQRVVGDPRLDEPLRREARQLLADL